MNADDMKEAGITQGGNVLVRSEHGEVTFKCVEGKVPSGMIFVPYGPPTCHLMGQSRTEPECRRPRAGRSKLSLWNDEVGLTEAAAAAPEAPSDPASDVLAWEQIEAGRYMPRRIRGSFRGRELG